DRTLQLWEAGTWKPSGPPRTYQGEHLGIGGISRDGQVVLLVRPEGPPAGGLTRQFWLPQPYILQTWKVATGEALGPPLTQKLSGWALSPDGTIILTTGGHEARLLRPATGEFFGQPLRHQGDIKAVAFSPDGRTFLTGSEDKTARLWDAATGESRGDPLYHP